MTDEKAVYTFVDCRLMKFNSYVSQYSVFVLIAD